MSLLFVSLIPLFDIFAFQYTYKLIFWWGISIFWLIILIAVILAFPYNEIKQNNEIEKDNEWFWISIWTVFKKWGFIIWSCLLVIISELSDFIWKISSPKSRVFNINIQYWLVPLWIILSTCLYFSLYQYSKAKQLRIENQNKIAILHWFQALRAEKWDWVVQWRFYDNIANVVFTKVYSKKVSNDLPVDKLVELAISNLLKKQ